MASTEPGSQVCVHVPPRDPSPRLPGSGRVSHLHSSGARPRSTADYFKQHACPWAQAFWFGKALPVLRPPTQCQNRGPRGVRNRREGEKPQERSFPFIDDIILKSRRKRFTDRWKWENGQVCRARAVICWKGTNFKNTPQKNLWPEINKHRSFLNGDDPPAPRTETPGNAPSHLRSRWKEGRGPRPPQVTWEDAETRFLL